MTVMVKNEQNKGLLARQSTNMNSGVLEIEKSRPGASLYYEETIQSSSRQEEGGNGTKEHAVRWLWRGTKLLRKAQKKCHVPACLPFLIKTECIHMQLALT
jgi:hypothetical protein